MTELDHTRKTAAATPERAKGESARTAASVRPARSLLRRCLTLLCLLSPLAVVFLPQIIAATKWRNHVVALVRPELPAGVEVRSAIFAWWEPIMLAGIDIPDDEGRRLATIEHFTTERTLWEIAVLGRPPGRIDIESPRLTVLAGRTGTNLDPIIDRWRAQPHRVDEPSHVRITDGHLDLYDAAGQSHWATLEAIHIDFERTPATDVEHRLTIVGRMTPAVRVNGETSPAEMPWQFAAHWTTAKDNPHAIGPGGFSLQVDRFPIEEILPLLPEGWRAEDATGELAVDVQGTWQALMVQNLAGSLHLRVEASNLTFTPPMHATGRDEPLQPISLANESLIASAHFLYALEEDLLELGRFTFESSWLTAECQGLVSDLQGRCLVELHGRADTDPRPFLDWLPPELGDQLVIEDLTVRGMSLEGPLFPLPENDSEAESLQIAASVGWSSASVFGLTSHDGEMNLGWNGQRLALTPVDLPFNGGRVTSLPDLFFTDSGVTLKFHEGMLLENAQIDEHLAREWLRYLSPLLANATAVEGRLSVSTQGGEVPLSHWHDSRLAGTLHVAEARLTPGPRVHPIMLLLRQFDQVLRLGVSDVTANTLLLLPEQEIPLTISDGRVHHEQLRIRAGEVDMQTSGSVGFDETLQLLIGLPIDEDWLQNRPVIAAALAGETITLGVTGTLNNPDIDATPLRDFSRRVAARASGRLLLQLLDQAIRD